MWNAAGIMMLPATTVPVRYTVSTVPDTEVPTKVNSAVLEKSGTYFFESL